MNRLQLRPVWRRRVRWIPLGHFPFPGSLPKTASPRSCRAHVLAFSAGRRRSDAHDCTSRGGACHGRLGRKQWPGSFLPRRRQGSLASSGRFPLRPAFMYLATAPPGVARAPRASPRLMPSLLLSRLGGSVCSAAFTSARRGHFWGRWRQSLSPAHRRCSAMIDADGCSRRGPADPTIRPRWPQPTYTQPVRPTVFGVGIAPARV